MITQELLNRPLVQIGRIVRVDNDFGIITDIQNHKEVIIQIKNRNRYRLNIKHFELCNDLFDINEMDNEGINKVLNDNFNKDEGIDLKKLTDFERFKLELKKEVEEKVLMNK